MSKIKATILSSTLEPSTSPHPNPFTKDHTEYTISVTIANLSTSPLTHVISRRYREFKTLHEKLCKINTNVKKINFVNGKQPRMGQLQDYLNSLGVGVGVGSGVVVVDAIAITGSSSNNSSNSSITPMIKSFLTIAHTGVSLTVPTFHYVGKTCYYTIQITDIEGCLSSADRRYSDFLTFKKKHTSIKTMIHFPGKNMLIKKSDNSSEECRRKGLERWLDEFNCMCTADWVGKDVKVGLFEFLNLSVLGKSLADDDDNGGVNDGGGGGGGGDAKVYLSSLRVDVDVDHVVEKAVVNEGSKIDATPISSSLIELSIDEGNIPSNTETATKTNHVKFTTPLPSPSPSPSSLPSPSPSQSPKSPKTPNKTPTTKSPPQTSTSSSKKKMTMKRAVSKSLSKNLGFSTKPKRSTKHCLSILSSKNLKSTAVLVDVLLCLKDSPGYADNDINVLLDLVLAYYEDARFIMKVFDVIHHWLCLKTTSAATSAVTSAVTSAATSADDDDDDDDCWVKHKQNDTRISMFLDAERVPTGVSVIFYAVKLNLNLILVSKEKEIGIGFITKMVELLMLLFERDVEVFKECRPTYAGAVLDDVFGLFSGIGDGAGDYGGDVCKDVCKDVEAMITALKVSKVK